MTYLTTQKDFELFKKRCEFWQRELGLLSWKIYYKHKNDSKALATCSTNYTGRVATISLATKWGIPVTEKELNESAIHEVLEALISPLWGMAASRVWDREEYEKEHHSIIRTLEKVLTNKKGV